MVQKFCNQQTLETVMVATDKNAIVLFGRANDQVSSNLWDAFESDPNGGYRFTRGMLGRDLHDYLADYSKKDVFLVRINDVRDYENEAVKRLVDLTPSVVLYGNDACKLPREILEQCTPVMDLTECERTAEDRDDLITLYKLCNDVIKEGESNGN